MSGGTGNKKRSSGRTQGWEEAGGEFYSESYPTGDIELDVFQRDPSHLATILPSKQSRFATSKHGARSIDTRTMRYRTTRSRLSTVTRHTSTVNQQEAHVSMMPDLSENLSNEELTWEEIMQIKAMPIPMYQKKEMKAKLQNATYLRLQGYEQFKWKQRKARQKLILKWNEILNKMELWKYSLKEIEGHFGTGIVSYFLFIKWLMFLNLINFLIIFLLVVLPQMFLESASTNNTVEYCSEQYWNTTNMAQPLIQDMIQGTGWFEYTVMFYGYYTNTMLKVTFTNLTNEADEDIEMKDSSFLYNLPLAYILVIISIFVISLLSVLQSAAKGFRHRLIECEGQYYYYSNIVFGGWDFCIKNEKSAVIQHKAMFNELKGSLLSDKLVEERQNRTGEEKIKLFFVRAFINIFVIFVLLVSIYFIYFIIDISWNYLLNHVSAEIPTQFTIFISDVHVDTLFFEFLPSLCIVALNMTVPVIFKWLIRFEKYNPGVKVRMSLMRVMLLRLSSLGVLIVAIYFLVLYKHLDANGTMIECKQPLCWETYVGQQIYKLLLTDFISQIFITFTVNFIRVLFARHIDNNCIQFIGAQEFELTKHVLDVVYVQTLCWLGMFFCPLLPALAFIVFFLMFYVKKFACLVNSTAPSTVYRASKSKSIFMYVLIFAFISSVIPMGFVISQLSPSKSCGPFRDLQNIWSMLYSMFLRVPGWLRSILYFLSTTSFVVPLLAVLILALYYYYIVNSANKHMVVVLKNQLVLEGHDKQFLLNRLSAFIKQQQEYQKKLRNVEIRERENDRANFSSSN